MLELNYFLQRLLVRHALGCIAQPPRTSGGRLMATELVTAHTLLHVQVTAV